MALEGGVNIPFQGRRYHIRPVPMELGLKLMEAQQDFDDAMERSRDAEKAGERPNPRDTKVMVRAYRRACRLMHRHARPRGPGWLLPSWLRRNRFLASSNQEFAELLGFFFSCRMMSSTLPRLAKQLQSVRYGTSWTPAQSLPEPSPPGQTEPPAFRGHGTTSP